MRHRLWIVLILTIIGTTDAMAEDAIIYREARQAHLVGEYESALAMYRQLDAEPYADAAGVYAADCLARLERTHEAIAAYEDFLAASEHEIYRLEATLELARLLCLGGAEGIDKAHGLLDEALAQLSEKLQEPPAKEQIDDPGQIHPLLRQPDALAEADETGPYARTLYAKALMLRLYTSVTLGEADDARSALQELRDSKGHALGDLTPIWLALERDVVRGSFLVPPSAWRAAGDTHGPALHLGLFYVRVHEWQLALELLESVREDTAEGAGAAADWALAETGLAVYEARQGRRSAAIRRLERFEGVLRATEAGPYGRLLLANLLSAQGNQRRANRLYSELADDGGTEPAPAQALLAMAQAGANRSDTTTLYRASDRLQQEHADSAEAAMARALLGAIGSSQAAGAGVRGQRRRGVSEPTVAVIEHARLLDGGQTTPSEGEPPVLWVHRLVPTAAVGNSWIDAVQPMVPIEQPQPSVGSETIYVHQMEMDP